MNFEILLLSFIQGIAEFLPISSSGHLYIFGHIFNLGTEGENFNTRILILHLGTLVALLIYQRSKIKFYLLNFFKSIWRKVSKKSLKIDANANKTLFNIVIGSLPIFALGYLLENILDNFYNNTDTAFYLTSASLTLLGCLYLLEQSFYPTKKVSLEKLSPLRALIIGLFQCLALIYGISRSGITIMAGQIVGLKRSDSVEFSFLLSIPVISGAVGYRIFKLFFVDHYKISNDMIAELGIGAILSFIIGYLSIAFLIQYLNRNNLKNFGFYCIFIGLFSLLIYIQ